MNVFEPFQFWRRAAANRPALMYPGGAITYGQLGSAADAAAHAIMKAGFRPKETVSVSVVNPVFQIMLMIALTRLNIPFVFLYDGNTGHDLGIKLAGSITEATTPQPGRVLRCDHKWFVNKLEQPVPSEVTSVDISPDDVLRFVLTSGSTGVQKAMAISHANMVARIRAAASHPGSGRTLSMLPPVGSWGFLVMAKVLCSGGTLCFAPFADHSLDLCETVQADVVCASVGQAATLAEEQTRRARELRSVRHLFIGGSPSSAQLVDRLRKQICRNISVGYGATETGQAASGPLSAFEDIAGAVGFTHPNVSVEIVDDNDRPVAAEKTGRVRIAGPGSAAAYTSDEANKSSAFKGAWFYTGDIGRFTRNGVLVIEGREDETVINKGGFKIAATKVEEALRKELTLTDVAVFAAATPDGAPQIWAAVVSAQAFDANAAQRDLESRLGAMAPDRIVRVNAIPRNEIGKILYHAVRSQLTAS